MHTTAGYMIGAAATFNYVFDYKPDDVYWCTADCGWITGHSYVAFGPMLMGAKQVLFEGVPTYPDAGRCWEVSGGGGMWVVVLVVVWASAAVWCLHFEPSSLDFACVSVPSCWPPF